MQKYFSVEFSCLLRSELYQSLMFACESPSTDVNDNNIRLKPEMETVQTPSINVKELMKDEIKDIYPALLDEVNHRIIRIIDTKI